MSATSYDRARALYSAGRLRDARDACIALLASGPPSAPAVALLATVLLDAGHPQDAAREFERALSINAVNMEAWLGTARAAAALGNHLQALAAIQKSLSLQPLHPNVHLHSANVLLSIGEHDRATDMARRATQLDPGLAAAWFTLALALHETQHPVDALAAAREAHRRDGGDASFAGFRAQLEAEAGELDTARSTLDRALERHPRHVGLLTESASVAARQNDIAAEIAAYEQLVALDANNGAALSQLVFAKKRACDWAGLADLQARVRMAVATQVSHVTPFSLLSDPSTRAEQRQCAQTWARGFAPSPSPPSPPPALPDPRGRRLRVGYLSGDFYQHPTAVLLAGVLEHHDRARFEVFAYSTGPDDGSAMRARIVAAVEHFTDIRERNPDRLATRIRADQLDVLVDLKGYTEGAPTAALAMRPAPIQVHWVGYPGTLAAPFIDYLMVDKIVVPGAHRADYAEALVWLPNCYQPNDRSRSPSPSAPVSRESLGLADADVVFAGFNAPWKLNAEVFGAWGRILAATPRSILWLLARDDRDPMTNNARREWVSRGIAAERIVFTTRRSEPDYLALYGAADIFLDTWPYNGHTTASDALWMGCPVVTRLGETFAGRVGASILHAGGLPELVADTTDDYVSLAIALSGDPARRVLLRAKLLRARAESPLFNGAAITRHVERAFETMIEQRANAKRESFEISAG